MVRAMGTVHRTAKHDVVKAWAEARSGKPARIKGTTDALKIDLGAVDEGFEPHPVPALEAVSWEDWFSTFDEKELAFVFEDPGFNCKVVRRNGREDGVKGVATAP